MARWTLLVLVVLTLAGCGGTTPPPRSHLPLTFVPQEGKVDFLAQGPGSAVFLTRDTIALTLQKPSGQGVALSSTSSAPTPRRRSPVSAARAARSPPSPTRR